MFEKVLNALPTLALISYWSYYAAKSTFNINLLSSQSEQVHFAVSLNGHNINLLHLMQKISGDNKFR